MELKRIIEIYTESKIEDYRLGTELPVSGLEIHTGEVDAFCSALPNIFEKAYNTYLSRYLTALIQQCKSKEISLNLPNLPILLNNFGYTLKDKKMIINGNLGELAFMYARDCLIEVRGNVGERLGYIADNCQFRVINGDIGTNPLECAGNCKLELIKNLKFNKK